MPTALLLSLAFCLIVSACVMVAWLWRNSPLTGWERIGVALSVIWFAVVLYITRLHTSYDHTIREWLLWAVTFWAVSTVLAWVIEGVLFKLFRWIRRGFEVK